MVSSKREKARGKHLGLVLDYERVLRAKRNEPAEAG
jgi:hypothetical protein